MKGGVVFKMHVSTTNDIKNYGDYDAYLKNAIYPNKVSTVSIVNFIYIYKEFFNLNNSL